MNGGDACRTIEETKSGGFHADVRSLCEALGVPSQPPPSSGRSEEPTQPYADPYADTLAAPSSFASDHPSWCIDVGTNLLTMTTFELWEALERGQVLTWMRVWREGMECWTPVGEIAEFAWAIAGTPPPPPEPVTLPDLQYDSPIASPAAIEAPPESTVRPVALPRPWSRHDARWIALGSAVALLAVVSAIMVTGRPAPAPPAETRGADTLVQTAEPPAPPPAPSTPLTEKPEPEATMRHGERGQHRQPRDGRRAHGR
jgi:hypothetical protein